MTAIDYFVRLYQRYTNLGDNALVEAEKVIASRKDESFLRCVRILTYSEMSFSRSIERLGPQFFCGHCPQISENDKYRDIANGCPGCERTYYQKAALEDARLAIKRSGGLPDGWTLEGMHQLVMALRFLFFDTDNHISFDWPEEFAALAREVKAEQCRQVVAQQWHAVNRASNREPVRLTVGAVSSSVTNRDQMF